MLTKPEQFIYPDLPRYVREENRCVLSFFGLPCEGPNEAHHEPPRSQGGSDDRVICLCRKHHRFRHDNPREFFSILKLSEIDKLERGYVRSYLRSLLDPDGEVKRPKVKVPKRKVEKKPKVSKFSKPLNVRNYMKEANP